MIALEFAQTFRHHTKYPQIPDKDVGLCIGRQGVVIRHMQNATQTRIQIPSHPVPGETYRIASISGPAAGCQQVKLMIETIVAEQSSVSVLSGGQLGGGAAAPGQAYYGGQQAMQQQHPGGPGDQHAYSADWAAYHAAQAAAAAQQQAATAAVAAVAAAQQQQQQQAAPQGAEAYHEQFFRYAYYYGEDAARQYYGAWSPPVGTPNPYGVNPNGVQPPPTTTAAAGAAAAEIPATSVDPSDPLFAATASSSTHPSAAPVSGQQPAQYQQPQARETSRRNVSNLPAWMTKG
jgi:far upstream element-binding protein